GLARNVQELGSVLWGANQPNSTGARTPQWFSLPQGSPQGILTIAFFVFANALFFDWVFDRFTQRTKPCLLCNQILDAKDLFCSTCGHVQT
ncbi:MAG: hypothetical protein MUO62_10405, partial [Anaerolineales bacterium]|nr:hypothetical protein [Anaerolineales bacterium]